MLEPHQGTYHDGEYEQDNHNDDDPQQDGAVHAFRRGARQRHLAQDWHKCGLSP